MTQLIKLDSINSTNTYLNYLLTNPGGLPEHLRVENVDLPVAVSASEQYAGRGRYGKSFHSPAGTGVYMSYGFLGQYDEADLLQLTVVAASLVHHVLEQHSDAPLSIKWINDIYKGERKVAGILTERVDDPLCSGKYYMIIGVGINVFPCSIPSELEGIVGFLEDEPVSAAENRDELDTITCELIAAFDKVFGAGGTGEFPNLVDYYRKNCFNLPADFGNKLFDK